MATTFFTAADRRYEYFAIPYALCALQSNPDAQIEICLENPDAFNIDHTRAISIISKSYPDRFVSRGGKFGGVTVNSVRFLETPLISNNFTYIGDIDILVLEHVTPAHVAKMEQTGLPYSNILRPSGKSLSGLHFTKTEAYYPVDASGLDLKMPDEALLFHLAKKGGLPTPGERWRPIHGIHLSPNRRPIGPAGEPDWGLQHTAFLDAFLGVRDGDVWQEVQPFLDPRFLSMLLLLQVAIDGKHPDFLDRSSASRDVVPHLRRIHNALAVRAANIDALEAKTASQALALEEARLSRDAWRRRAKKANGRAKKVKSVSWFRALAPRGAKSKSTPTDLAPQSQPTSLKRANDPRTVFESIYRRNHWGNAESVSGPGSTKSATVDLVPQIAHLLETLGVKSMTDAPCGDFNWIAPIAHQLVKYNGLDIVPEVISTAKARSGDAINIDFYVSDLTAETPPRSDIFLCRDCLVHLTFEQGLAAIAHIKASGSPWLLTTTFPDLDRNNDAPTGGWRPINLELEPFRFPSPKAVIIERPNSTPNESWGRKSLAGC